MNVLLLLCVCPLLAGYVPNWFGRGVSNLSMSNLPNVLSCCTFVLYLVFICVACFSVLGDRVTFAAFFLCNMFLLSVSWRGALPAMLLLLQMAPKATVVCDMTVSQGAAPSSSSCKTVTCDMVKLQQLRNTSMLFNQTLNTEFFDDWATSFDIRLSTVTTLTDTGNSGASTLLSHTEPTMSLIMKGSLIAKAHSAL